MALWSWFRRKRGSDNGMGMEDRLRNGCWSCHAKNQLVHQRDLRIGHLYACAKCAAITYAWEYWPNIGAVQPEDMPLIDAWDAQPMTIEDRFQTVLKHIGKSATHPTPSNAETPCAVTTRSGEYFPCAIVREQNYAPYGGAAKRWRLVSEIAEMTPSPHALPQSVREGTGNATDVYKNVYHAEFVMPDGHYFDCAGLINFMVHPNYNSADAKMQPQGKWGKGVAEGYPPQPEDIVYFIADPFRPLWHYGSD